MSHAMAHRDNQPAVRFHAGHVHTVPVENRPRRPSLLGRNGNVIVLKSEIHEEVTNWNGIGASNCFVVKDSSGARVAVVDGAGDVYLAGEVLDGRATEAAPPNAFAVKAADGGVASWIDSSGNLKARGQVIVKGVPYILERDCTTDTYRAEM